jgi:hypothetical protein
VSDPESNDPSAALRARIRAAEAEREARRASLEVASLEQQAADAEKRNELEAQFGASSVHFVEIPYTSGLPTLAAARAPKPAEIKRYHARVKGDGESPGDPIEAAIELGAVALVYPDDATFARMCSARAELALQLGMGAVRLAQGKAVREGKA